jgi:hypothetical protein
MWGSRWQRVQSVAEFAAAGDAELGEDLEQVPFSRAGGQEQLGADLGMGLAAASEGGDERLLVGEGADGFDGAFGDARRDGLPTV